MCYTYYISHPNKMSKKQVKQLCQDIQKYYIDRMCDFCEEQRNEDATALYEEIREWLQEKDKPTILSIRRVSKT